MKPLTPHARLKWLRDNLRYTQMDNRIAAGDLRRGIAKAKRLGAEMREVQSEITKIKNRKPGCESAKEKL